MTEGRRDPVMSQARWERIKDLVHQALQLPAPERGQFLDDACGSDVDLRAEVESLLSVDAQTCGTFLDSALRIGATGAEDGIDALEALAEGLLFEQRFQLVRRLAGAHCKPGGKHAQASKTYLPVVGSGLQVVGPASAPEMDMNSLSSALTLLFGCVLVLRARFKQSS